MVADLDADDGHIANAVLAIVDSQQFRMIRGGSSTEHEN
jgi:hypothetical protein